jgi:Tfp pilus assembly protein PilN
MGVAFLEEGVAIGHLKGSAKGFRLARFVFFSQEPNLSWKERADTAVILIEDFRKEHRVGRTDLFLGIPAGLAMTRVVTLPLVAKENIRFTLTHEMEKYIPLPMDEIAFDHCIVRENKANNRMSVLIVAVKRKDLKPFLELCETLPGGISGIELLTTAAVSALSHLGNPPDPENCGQAVSDRKISAANLETADPKKKQRAGVETEGELYCFGLGLRSFLRQTPVVNLVPGELRRKPSRLGVYLLILLMATTLATGLFWAGSHLFRQRLEYNRLAQEAERLSEAVREIEAYRVRKESIQKRIEEIRTVESGVSVLEILRELTELLPETVWVQDLSVDGDRVIIQGLAQSPSADIIPLLEASPFFREAVFLSAITRKPDGQEDFRIGFSVVTMP